MALTDGLTCTVPQEEPSTKTIQSNTKQAIGEFDDVIVARTITKSLKEAFKEALDPAYVNRHVFNQWTPKESK